MDLNNLKMKIIHHPPLTVNIKKIDEVIYKTIQEIVAQHTDTANARATLDCQPCVITPTLFEMNSTCMVL